MKASTPWICFLPLFAILSSSSAIKIAIFVPDISGSQLIWNTRVAEVLYKAGHDITLIRLKLFKVTKTDPKISEGIKQWHIEAFGLDYDEMQRKQSFMIFDDVSYLDSRMRQIIAESVEGLTKSCELTVKKKEFIEQLKAEKFELAFAHMYDFCAIGLIRAGNIPTWIWLNSAQLMDYVAEYVGVPSPPSYVPPLAAESTDRMTFIQRVKSFIGHIITPMIVEKYVVAKETEIFRRHVDPNFPDLIDIAKSCPLVMVNSNELYNLPRPTLHKIIYIGGLGMKFGNARPLTGEFESIADRAKHIVLMTFGSVANASAMPDSWKSAFMNSFRNFPDVEFIVRYPANDLDEKKPKNVHLSKWIPQADLLQHDKTRMLITHGGYNSLQEAINSGIPMITIPLFGDQPANSKLSEQHGFSYNLKKADISEESITKAIRALLEDKSYTENIRRMRAMVMKKPSQPEELLVKWTEFLAEFKTLDNLVPYGTKLGFFQYHSLDVIATLSITVFTIVFLIYKIALFVICFLVAKYSRKEPKIKKQ